MRIKEKSYIEEMLKDLRKITEFNATKQHVEDLDAVNKWISKLLQNTNDEYLNNDYHTTYSGKLAKYTKTPRDIHKN